MPGPSGDATVKIEMHDIFGKGDSSFTSIEYELDEKRRAGLRKASPRSPTLFEQARDAGRPSSHAVSRAKYMTWAKFLDHVDRVKNSVETPDPVYTQKSLYLFTPDNPLRKIAIRIAHYPWFDRFILSLIILNCGFMIISAPYAPCCRPGETVQEGGNTISSFSEMTDGFSCDVTDAALGTRTFIPSSLETSFVNMTGKCLSPNGSQDLTKGSASQTVCSLHGLMKFRSVKDRKDAFPDHLAGTLPDSNWPWQQTAEKCCVPEEWASKNGIYQSQLPDFEALYPNVSGHRQDVFELQPTMCSSYTIIDAYIMADYVFVGFFTFECVVKIIARGFIMDKGDPRKHMPPAYLRDPWNWLDFIVVVAAWWGMYNATVLRTFRILRPLRGLNKWPSMKMLVRSLLRSLPPMKYVGYLMAFLLLIFGVVGVQLWNGLLHGQCQYWDPSNTEEGPWVADPGQDGLVCGLPYIPVHDPSYSDAVAVGATVTMSGDEYVRISELLYLPLDEGGKITSDGRAFDWANSYSNDTTVARIGQYYSTARKCEDMTYGSQTWGVDIMTNISLLDGQLLEIPTMACRFGANPNFNLSSFDNLLHAVLWIFASITLEGWVDAMYAVNQAWLFNAGLGTFFVEGIYFTLLYILGSMFMLNLTLAVIWEEFENEHERMEEDEAMLISEELKILQRQGYTVQDQTEGEAMARKAHREAAARAELTGDPVPDPWTKTQCIVRGWYALSIHPWFGHFITLHIIVNTVMMALETHNWRLFRETFNWEKPDVYMQNKIAGEALSEPPSMTTALNTMNNYFAMIFLLEAIIKLIGLSPRHYFRDGFNCFDFAIVVFSIVEFVLSVVYDMQSVAGLSVLRSFRLLRVLKLAKTWKTLQELIRTILAAISDVMVAGCLLVVIMLIFSFLGMELFGGNWNVETFGSADDVPRANFDSFFNAFMAVFQVLTGENWNDLLWAAYKTTGFLGWFYFIALTFVGNYMIFNLFLAILLSKFEEGDHMAMLDKQDQLEEREKEVAGKKRQAELAAAALILAKVNDKKSSARSSPQSTSGDLTSAQGEGTKMESNKVLSKEGTKRADAGGSAGLAGEDNEGIGSAETEKAMECVGVSLFILPPDNVVRTACFRLASNKIFDKIIFFLILLSSLLLAMDEPWVSACACYDPSAGAPTSSGNDGYDTMGELKVVGVPGPSWSIACTSETPKAWAMTTGTMDGNSMGYYKFLIYSDLIVTVVFTFEMVVKVIALGFVLHPGSYLRNSWNVLDFAIVIISLISVATGPLALGTCVLDATRRGALKSLRSLRALRALRPLRAIKRAPGLRLVVNSLFLALPAITQVGMVTLLFMTILAVLGQQFFMGQLAVCNDGDAPMFTDCYGNFTLRGTDCGKLPNARYATLFTADEWATFADPIKTPLFALDSVSQCEANGNIGSQFPRIWQSHAVNFDTFGNALTTVFEVASGEMWPDIMATAIDARGIGVKPLPNARPVAFFWFFFVQFIIAFVMLNVFIGVIIEKYNENKDNSEGSGLLTNEQKIWVETMKLTLNSRAKRRLLHPTFLKPYRMWAYKLVTWATFDYGIMVCIILNVILMACGHYNQSVQWHRALTISMWIFNVIFTVEMLVKWLGIGTQYFKDPWNNLDCALVLLSWVGQVSWLPPTLASLFRIFRVMRMLRLVRNVKGLLKLFKTLIYSIPALMNVGIIMGLIMFICANLAMNSFANVKEGEILTGDANFQTFWLSFNTMWRMSSGESYNGIMHDANVQMPYCSPHKGGRINPYEGNCGDQFMSFFVFQLCFTVLNYVLVNLFIAIILDNFSDECAMSESSVTAEILDDFDEVWLTFDPRGTQRIPETRLGQILEQVYYPLGLKKVPVEHLHGKSLRKYKNRMIQALQIPSVNGMINFLQTKRALTLFAMGEEPLDEVASEAAMVKKFKRQQAKVEKRLHEDIVVATGGRNGLQRSHSFQILSDGTKIPYGVKHVHAAMYMQAIFRGYKARKSRATSGNDSAKKRNRKKRAKS